MMLIGMSAVDSEAVGWAVVMLLAGAVMLVAGDRLQDGREKTDRKIYARRENSMDVYKRIEFVSNEVKKIKKDVDKLQASEKEKILIQRKIVQELTEETVDKAMIWDGEDADTRGNYPKAV